MPITDVGELEDLTRSEILESLSHVIRSSPNTHNTVLDRILFHLEKIANEEDFDQDGAPDTQFMLQAVINGHQFAEHRFQKVAHCVHCEEELPLDGHNYKCMLCLSNCHRQCVPYLQRCSEEDNRTKRRGPKSAVSTDDLPTVQLQSDTSNLFDSFSEDTIVDRIIHGHDGDDDDDDDADGGSAIKHRATKREQRRQQKTKRRSKQLVGSTTLTSIADGSDDDDDDVDDDEDVLENSDYGESDLENSDFDDDDDENDENGGDATDHSDSDSGARDSRGASQRKRMDDGETPSNKSSVRFKEGEDNEGGKADGSSDNTGADSRSSSNRDKRRKNKTMLKKFRTGARRREFSKSFKLRLQASRKMEPPALERAISNEQHLNHEFEQIPEHGAREADMPRMTSDKNRYFNILPNNHTRVVLPQEMADPTTTYINANFMDGFDKQPEAYIATQGPMKTTMRDFWRMIWAVETRVVVMNTGLVENGKEKCTRYWPASVGETMAFDPIIDPDFQTPFEKVTVTLLEEETTCPQFVTSKLELACDDEKRTITHLWWKSWPDKGVPETSEGITEFITAARDANSGAAGPIVVHCSAGVGRTGCFIAIDVGMQAYDTYGSVDVLATVCQLRKNRGFTVQTVKQYTFIHSCLLDYMASKGYAKGSGEATSQATQLLSNNGPRLLLAGPLSTTSKTSSTSLMGNLDGANTPNSDADDQRSRSSSAREAADGTGVFDRQKTFRRSSRASIKKDGETSEDEIAQEHEFNTKTYVKDTPCDICGDLLTGVARQGMQCRGCKSNVHHYCLERISAACDGHARKERALPVWPPPKMRGLSLRRKSRYFRN